MNAPNVEKHIGQYKILRTLGAGGMGTVYLGEHLLLGRRAAIKTLLPSLSSHREIVDRFFNEARAISAISDPGVVQIFDFGYHVDGTAYIVMEFLEGESLAQRLDRLAKLPLADSLRITRQIASSLAAAHARGIIHRDLKPGNVFLIRDSEAQGGERTKILDFGIAKLISSPTDLVTTQTGMMLGTPIYMSPEQCRGGGKIDHRSDIYSVGAALFHMLTGVPPFDCDSVGDFIAAHLREEPPTPSELAPELSPAVDALVLRCLAKDPQDRFQSMSELSAACDEILATLSEPGRVAPPPPVLPKTPLGSGFHSAYDVNHSSHARARTPRPTPMTLNEKRPTGTKPSHPWFVDSLNPASSANLRDDAPDWEEPERGMSMLQRIGLVAALFVGLIGGIAVTGYLMDDSDDRARAATVNAPGPTEVTAPAAGTTNEAKPPEPVAGGDVAVEPELDPTAEAPAAAPAADEPVPLELPEVIDELNKAPTAKQKPDRPHPARTNQRPRPRRPVTEPDSIPETSSQEDLYDTR